MNPRSATVVAALTAAGCTWGEPPAQAVLSVAPAALEAGSERVLTISAIDLDDVVAVDFDVPGPVCDYFQVVLRSASGDVVPLADVVRTGAGELRGRVPASAPRAAYDVTVVDPAGHMASLANGFTVAACSHDCVDGNTCTSGDSCDASGRCRAGTPAADGTPCQDRRCTWGDAPGTCAAGACVASPGACPPPPAACGVR